jgi:hypothetical protein
MMLSALATLAPVACTTSASPPKPAPRHPGESEPPLKIEALGDVLSSVGLKWLVQAEPETLLALPWLKPSLGRILRDERLDVLARATALDLRRVPELVVAGYRAPTGGKPHDDLVAYFVRHRREPLAIERKFRERLTSRALRHVASSQAVAVWGNIGLTPHGFVALGKDVVGFQYGGTRRRGPVRLALLYGRGQLARTTTISADRALGALVEALHARATTTAPGSAARQATLHALFPGPFDGDMARGARGLLAAASAAGCALSPTERPSLAFRVVLIGDYAGGDPRPFLEGAWTDLAGSDLGHLLGLHEPLAPPASKHEPGHLALDVELDPERLVGGLASVTMDDVADILR